MADLNIEGNAPTNPTKEDKDAKRTHVTKEKVAEPELKDTKGQIQIIPSTTGNEMTVLIQMLASLNKNVAFLASTIYKHLNPEVKDGRPKQ